MARLKMLTRLQALKFGVSVPPTDLQTVTIYHLRLDCKDYSEKVVLIILLNE